MATSTVYLTEYDGTLDVEFSQQDDKGAMRWDATGSGNATQVFSTVIAGIIEFLNKAMQDGVDIEAIRFEASKADRSRASLYKRMVQRFGKQWGYSSVSMRDQGDSIQFVVTE